MGNKRQKRLAKLKKKNNIRKNNMPTRKYMWMPVQKEPEVVAKDGQNVLHPKDIDPDWEYEEAKQRGMERDEERLQEMANNDLYR